MDSFQQRHPVLALPVAVLVRYREERGAWFGAVISYYGLFSLVPLLLAAVTVVTIVFEPTPSFLQALLDALWVRLPFVGEELRGQIKPVEGEPAVVVIALIIATWGGLRVLRVSQDALDQMWCVPRSGRPGIVRRLARGVLLLALMLVGLVVATASAAVVVSRDPALGARFGAGVSNVVFNAVFVLAVFRFLPARRLSWRELLPGALVAAAGLLVLTLLGGVYVDRVVDRTSALYGSFATVIGLFAWVSLAVQAMVIGNLVNVVRVARLWPRTFRGDGASDGDRRAAELSRSREALA